MSRFYISSGSWTKLPYSVGSIQNLSEKYNVLISEQNTESDMGQELKPGQALNFTTQLYARSGRTGKNLQISVNPFQDTVGGGSGGSGGNVDLSSYATRTEVQNMITTATNGVVYDKPTTFLTQGQIDALFNL